METGGRCADRIATPEPLGYTPGPPVPSGPRVHDVLPRLGTQKRRPTGSRRRRAVQTRVGYRPWVRPVSPFGASKDTYSACSRKEVIQPQVPLRLPCYDFAPVIELAFGRCLPRVGSRTSGAPNFHGVTGGVYKARERIHRGVADPRLLAIPTSCSRVTDCNPNLDRVFPIRSTSRHRFGLSRPL
jgi:hypothetical protein